MAAANRQRTPRARAILRTIAEVLGMGQANALTHDRERRLRAELEAISRASLVISRTIDLKDALQTIVDQARLVTGAEYAALGVEADAARPFAPWVFSGMTTEEAAAIGRVPRPVGTLGLIAHEGQTIRVADIRRHPAFAGFPTHHPPMGSFLGVPVRYNGRSLGNLYLARRVGAEEFTEDSQRTVELLATHAGVALYQGQLRRAVEAERARLQTILENAPYGILFVEPATDRVAANPALVRILGGPLVPDAGRAQYVGRVFARDGRPLTLAELPSSLALGGQAVEDAEYLVLHPDGRRVPVVASATPVFGSAGEVIGAVVVVRDITERRRIEAERERLLAELNVERGWLRTVVERSPVGIILIGGPGGERVVANRRADELFGHPLVAGAATAQAAAQVCRPDGTPLAQAELASTRALRGQTVQEEQIIRRPDGGTVPVLVSAGPMHDAAGNVVGAVVVLEDITVLKELERLREEWMAVIAHDLQQPITAIGGYAALAAGLAEQRGAGAQEQSYLEHIVTSTRRLSRMIADLLDVSRIEVGRLPLERQPVDLPALVRAVVERTADVTRGHPVRVGVEGAIPPVAADPSRLEQVLGNLLSNAARYGYPDSEIRVEVARQNAGVRVSVANQGRGIPAEELPNLFTRFYRAGRAQEERTAGLGLGLYICKGLVEAHGGRIWVESVPEQTTTFHFTLPGKANTWLAV
ncbi:MAG: PAS domain S-box protein [Chloroflexi bacterium]|nr:PAS domain S-box protein [Chloroflexota bacterium]